MLGPLPTLAVALRIGLRARAIGRNLDIAADVLGALVAVGPDHEDLIVLAVASRSCAGLA